MNSTIKETPEFESFELDLSESKPTDEMTEREQEGDGEGDGDGLDPTEFSSLTNQTQFGLETKESYTSNFSTSQITKKGFLSESSYPFSNPSEPINWFNFYLFTILSISVFLSLVLLFTVGFNPKYFFFQSFLLENVDSRVENRFDQILENNTIIEIDKFLQNLDSKNLIKPQFSSNPYYILPEMPLKKIGNSDYKPIGKLSDEVLNIFAKFDQSDDFGKYKIIKKIQKYNNRAFIPIFLEGLQQKSFWIRMESAIGLIRTGENMSTIEIERILKSVSTNTINRYLERFRNSSIEAKKYILRKILKSRIMVIKPKALTLLAKKPNNLDKLYLNAAYYDNSIEVKRWVTKNPKLVNKKDLMRYNEIWFKKFNNIIHLNQ